MAAKTRNAAWVADYLGTSPQTVGRLIKEGKIEAHRLRERGQWRITVKSVDEYLRSRIAQYGVGNAGTSR